MQLTSRSHESPDLAAAIELCFTNGWTDGLPVVPPTEDRIAAMLAAGGSTPNTRSPSSRTARFPSPPKKSRSMRSWPAARPSTCRSSLRRSKRSPIRSTAITGRRPAPAAPAVFMVVNGPIARELDINCGDNLFGPGWRANATIGRAVRLVMRNVIGTLPGELDRSSLGHGGKYTYCIAENEAESPWPPLHTTRGFSREQNAVTIFAALAPHQYSNRLSATPEGILETACAHMRISRGHGAPAAIRAGVRGRAHGDHAQSRLDARRRPALLFRAFANLDGRAEAHQLEGRRRHPGGRDATWYTRGRTPRIFSSSRQAERPACSRPTFPAGAARTVRKASRKEIHRP